MYRLALLGTVLLLSCGNKDEYGGLYDICEEVEDCDGRVPDDADAACVDKESEGFCTWLCEEDTDCNEEFDEDFDYLCAPFEEADDTYCFPDCKEDEEDEDDVCPPGYGCRSTGGGAENRRICFPN